MLNRYLGDVKPYYAKWREVGFIIPKGGKTNQLKRSKTGEGRPRCLVIPATFWDDEGGTPGTLEKVEGVPSNTNKIKLVTPGTLGTPTNNFFIGGDIPVEQNLQEKVKNIQDKNIVFPGVPGVPGVTAPNDAGLERHTQKRLSVPGVPPNNDAAFEFQSSKIKNVEPTDVEPIDEPPAGFEEHHNAAPVTNYGYAPQEDDDIGANDVPSPKHDEVDPPTENQTWASELRLIWYDLDIVGVQATQDALDQAKIGDDVLWGKITDFMSNNHQAGKKDLLRFVAGQLGLKVDNTVPHTQNNRERRAERVLAQSN